MDSESSELWCEHEFIVRVNSRSASETHCVSLYRDGEFAQDVVVDDVENRLAKIVNVEGTVRDEVEYNRFGQVVVSRCIQKRDDGMIVISEVLHGSMHSERITVSQPDGKKVSFKEDLFCNGQLQSSSDTYYTTTGAPSLTVTSNYASDGRVIRFDQVVWHGIDCPAISESTEYDWYGEPQLQTKVLHNTDGTPMWEEKLNFRNQPCSAI